MKRLDKYLLRQLMTPLIFATGVITALVWLTQSLQRLDLIIDYGEGWSTFGWLTMLLIPNLLAVIIPFAFFGAALFALHRLHSDSEIAVIFAAGVSRSRIAAPILIVAMLGAAITLWINVDLMPRSYRELKQNIAEIRADFAAVVLRSGEFTTFSDGFTIYVEESLGEGQFRGLLVNDYRNGDKAETYMAQYGKLQETNQGPVLLLSNGNVQTNDPETEAIDVVRFDGTAINIAGFTDPGDDFQLELTERYLGELLQPDLSSTWDRDNRTKLIAEGHSRLASPLFVIAYALLAIFALTGGAYNRRGYGLRIATACAVAGGLKVLSFVLQNTAAQMEAYWLIYAVPIVPTVLLAFLLADLQALFLARPSPEERVA